MIFDSITKRDLAAAAVGSVLTITVQKAYKKLTKKKKSRKDDEDNE